jgi:hypothetical protein
MRLEHTPEFASERKRYQFAFTCEECAHFDRRAERCRHEYPATEHRQAFYERPGQEVVFCKEFELQ